MKRAQIVGVGAYAPQRILTNAELEKLVETSDEWIVQRTGIRERRIVDDERRSVGPRPPGGPAGAGARRRGRPRRSTSSSWARRWAT